MMQKVSILIVKFPFSSSLGGGEYHTVQLFQRLKEKYGVDFSLVSSCPVLLKLFRERQWNCKRIWIGVEPVTILNVFLYPFLLPYTLIRLTIELVKFRRKSCKLQAANCTLILYCLSYTEKFSIAPIARLLGYRVFFVEHLMLKKSILKNPLRFLFTLNIRFAKVIAVVKALEEQFRKELKVREKNIMTIYNGVDFEEIAKITDYGLRITDKTLKSNNSHRSIRIGTVARLASEKGIDDLVQSFDIVLKNLKVQNPQSKIRDREIQLKIIGSGQLEEYLKSLAKELRIDKSVAFITEYLPHDQLLKEVSTWDIFCLTPTFNETFGIAAAEAQALGVPVVATNIGGLSEVIDDQKSGFIVPSGNVLAIAEKIRLLIENYELRKKMGEYGKEYIRSQFGIERMVKEYQSELML